MNNESVASYLRDGCGRCERYRTPQCNVHRWAEPLDALVALLRAAPLVETMKWGSPCYTVDGKNVAMIGASNGDCALSFLQGAALDDPDGLLERPGPNTRLARLVRFHDAAQVRERRAALERLLDQAIALRRSGAAIDIEPPAEDMPAELQQALDDDPALAAAFEALTPGRQRSYRLHVGGAKQAATRARRAAACAPKIMSGKGFNER